MFSLRQALLLIIHKGKKIVEGNVSELLDPSNTLLQLETTDDAAAFKKLQTTAWATNTKYDKGRLKLTISKSGIPNLVAKLTEMDVGIIAIKPRHSLEDYFLSLTNHEADA